ncbi:restriction endonuclease subunit S [Leuconostoc mesenteroides]|uniref:restriction endonuclease subunit S n=3 Tax=Leuconostoc mesenteroides TaxID=1245 RepID=UPI0023622461|nr:restriction endonuclease subunit S [Leuconostoc mesenteroides]
MAKIDDSVKKKVPELRFKGFTDDWEERKLGEFSDVRDGTHASPKYVSQGHPMVTSKNLTHSGLDMTDVSFLTDEYFNEINKRSKVSIGDILFGMIGTIGNPVIVDRDDFAIKNVALIKEKTSNPITNKWLLQYLKSPSFNRFIQKENAGGTQKFIALGLIRDMKLRVPEFDEQQKIGAFFKKIDETITLHQRKLDLLKEQKKGFLQKMFPKNGSRVPELRFSGFADDWEERKLGDEVRIVMGQSPNSENYTDDPNDYILVQGNADMKNGRVFPRVWTTQVTKQAEKDDLILSVRAPVGDIGKTAYDVVIGRGVAAIKGNEFIFQNLGKMKSDGYWTRYSTGSTFESINSTDIKEAIISVPAIEEQNKIGSLFSLLDKTIALHQRKLYLLKEQKKGFLQKMFV